jgi:dihydrofolate synthase / folylpolyglutamate synthase
LWVAMALRWFAEQHVDLAVVEVGAGGRFDLTNVVSPAVSVITSIGLDHTETLGPTIEEITWNKAGIIKAGAPVVTAVRDREAMEPILREAKRVGVQVIQIEDSVGPPSLPHPPGGFQLTNAKVAMAAIEQLAPIGFSATPDRIFRGLSEARIPGRLERVQTEPVVVLDGAHNPQKIASLVESMGEVIGEERPIVLLGILASKDAGEIVSLISSVASELILTRPRVLAKTGFEPRVLAELASKAGFCGAVEAAGDPRDALDLALSRSREESGRPVLVTGSLYLVGNLRGRWYPDDQIVLQRTPWPVT